MIIPTAPLTDEAAPRTHSALQARVLSACDAAMVGLAFLTAALASAAISETLLARPYRDLLAGDTLLRLLQVAGLAGALIGGLYLKGHYRRRMPFWIEAKHVAAGCLLALLADGFLMFALKADFSRLWVIQVWAWPAVLIPIGRSVVRRILDRMGRWRIPVVVVGNGAEAEEACQILGAELALGYRVVRVVAPAAVEQHPDRPYWADLCAENGAEMPVLALTSAEAVEYGALLSDLVRERRPFAITLPLPGLPVLGLDQFYFVSHDLTMLVGRNNLADGPARLIKGISDRLGAALLLLPALPLFLLFAPIIGASGPVFYGHERVGRNGRRFSCLKFRTMVPDAEAKLAAVLASDPAAREEWRLSRKLRNDPRVTAFGRFLRRSSLDELPQLINVLRGEMSLVGPRPITEEELEWYGRDAAYYFEAKPGITGLWQISGRSDTSYEQRVRLDVWYVKNWSLWHDVAILAQTLPVVLRRIGAV